jgi:hypothetical protein
VTEIIHLVNYEAASGWFFSSDEIGLTNYEEVDLAFWILLQAQGSVQNQSVTNGVITQVHKLIAQNVLQSRSVREFIRMAKGYGMGGRSYDASLPYLSVIDGITFADETGFVCASSLSIVRYPQGASSVLKGYAAGGATTGATPSSLVETISFSSEAVETHSSSLANTNVNVIGTSFSSGTSGYFVEAPTTAGSRNIQTLLFSTGTVIAKTNALSTGMVYSEAFCASTKGYTCGGNTATTKTKILGLTLATETSSDPVATLAVGIYMGASVQDATQGFTIAGTNNGTPLSSINKFLFSTETATQVSGSTATAKVRTRGVSSATKGYALGGITASSVNLSDISSINFSTLTTAVESTTLGTPRAGMAGVQST